MIDAKAAAELHCHRQGETVKVTLGGKGDANFSGRPLDSDGWAIQAFGRRICRRRAYTGRAWP
ncbi:hypothetical protein [Phyllobacterium sp. K27]